MFKELSEEDKSRKIMYTALMACQAFVLNPANRVEGIEEYIQYKKDMIDYICDKLDMEAEKGHLY
jgi:hypothetical protein